MAKAMKAMKAMKQARKKPAAPAAQKTMKAMKEKCKNKDCFLLGLFYQLMDSSLERYLTPFLFIGFLGAFTTFSAFSKESLELLYQGNFLMAFLYVILSVSSCLVATWLGMNLTKIS